MLIVKCWIVVTDEGSRSTFNTVTSILDAGFVYGTDEEKSRKLRVFRGGLLKSNSMHRDKGLKDLLPPNLDEKACKRDGERFDCFLAGNFLANGIGSNESS